MARIVIESDEGWPPVRIEVRRDVDTGEAVGFCDEHQEEITDRGHFEDTCEAIANHIDMKHGASARMDTGILLNAHRCTDCTFTTASADHMDGHLRATGHRHEGMLR